MIQTLHYQQLIGEVTVPASKSVLQRVLAAALLAEGESQIHRLSRSKDCLAAQSIIERLGAQTEEDYDALWVYSRGLRPRASEIDCGESGLALRMFTSIAALGGNALVFKGVGSLLKRPIAFFKEHLPLFGVEVQTNFGFLPMQINGRLQAANARIDGSQSSQYLTGLLMALVKCEGTSLLEVKNLNSQPYIDLTIRVLDKFGVKIEHYQYKEFHVLGNQNYRPQIYTVEGDWSGAAFWLVAGALGNDILVKGLDMDSAQADKAILQALEQCGAVLDINKMGIKVRQDNLRAFDFDAMHCPDLFPPLVALAAHCSGKTRIHGVSRLVDKESNRALALQTEFEKFGIRISLQGEWMEIEGGKVQDADLHSHHDHRIAMALAIAGKGKKLRIEEAQAVEKSYPDFWKHLNEMNYFGR